LVPSGWISTENIGLPENKNTLRTQMQFENTWSKSPKIFNDRTNCTVYNRLLAVQRRLKYKYGHISI